MSSRTGAYLTLVIAAMAVALLYKSFSGGVARAPNARGRTVPSNGLIAFESQRDIYVVNPDGSGVTDLSNTPPTDKEGEVVEAPWAWSPDGSKLAYYGYVYGPDSGGSNYDISVMNSDGTGIVNLTGADDNLPTGADYSDPQWSPDGTRIAFVGLSGDGSDLAIYVSRVDGTGTIRLATGGNPSWSPDGKKIALDSGGDIYVVDADGSQLSRLTQGAGSSSEPAWSPDGTQIAFLSDRDGTPEMYVSSVDGTTQERISDSAATGMGPPAWSPDGTQLLFEAFAKGNWDIYVANADGSGQLDLTPDPNDEDSAVWSPDGTKIAFVASKPISADPRNEASADIYVMNADGSARTPVTPGLPVGHHVAWQPILLS